MTARFDSIVVGAGHNGLTAACTLAGKGRRVLVLERRAIVGGLAAAEEFHPGFRSPGVHHDSTGVRDWIVESLGLEAHGLRRPDRAPELLALDGAGSSLVLSRDARRSAAAIAELSATDAKRYAEFRDFLGRVQGVLRTLTDKPPVDLVHPETGNPFDLFRRGLQLRRLGRDGMTEFLRLPPMSVADWLDEWFESDLLKAALAIPAVAATYSGPRSPGSALNLLLHEGAAGRGVDGGGPALIAALESCARAAGVEIRTEAPVREIALGPHGVRGVVLEDGTTIEAGTVAASCDPRQTFLELLPAGSVTDRLDRRMKNLRSRGTMAQLLLAVRGKVDLPQASGLEHARLGASLDDLERAHDDVKYRRCSSKPFLEIYRPAADRGLAPQGDAVVSVRVHFAPHDLEGGWTETERERLADRVVEALSICLPGIDSRVLARRMLCPASLESLYGVPGGHPFHVEHAMDQLLVRPTPETCRYATPVPGLYLCGSGSHPGGGLTCAPGALAAAAILKA